MAIIELEKGSRVIKSHVEVQAFAADASEEVTRGI
jgi:hypothetical protein